MIAHVREARPLVRLRVPFTVNRTDIDDVERGSQDSDWDPVKDAAKKLAFVEDRAIFEGYEAAHIGGVRKTSSNPPLQLPQDPREIPDVISQALSELRLAGVDGPYSVLLSADVYTKVSETTVNGYPIREHINRLVDGDIIWAPAIDGAFVLSRRTPRSTDQRQAASTASSAEWNMPSPSSDGPVSASVACSGCGIRPTTRPLAELTPAMSRSEPLRFSA